MLSRLHVKPEVSVGKFVGRSIRNWENSLASEGRIYIGNVRNRNEIEMSNLQGNSVTTMILPKSECGWLLLIQEEILRLDPEESPEKIFEKPGDSQTDCIFGFWIRFRYFNDFLPMHEIPTKSRRPLTSICTFQLWS